MENGVTRVHTNQVSSITVEHMKARVVMGRMFRISLQEEVIKMKLGVSWKMVLKIPYMWTILSTSGFVLEFIDEDEV